METNIVSCECGSKVRVPVGQRTRAFRCPKCKLPLALTSKATILAVTEIDTGQDAICSICQTDIQIEERCVTCPSCDQVHHEECWAEIGGCGTYGCDEAPEIEKSETSVDSPLTAWGDTKKCPACGEEIKSIAMRCRYCSTEFGSVDPMSIEDLRQNLQSGDQVERLKKIIIALFVLSVVGFLSPVMVIVNAAYLLPRRAKVAKCGPLFLVMSWTAILLSTFYTIMMIVFLLMSDG